METVLLGPRRIFVAPDRVEHAVPGDCHRNLLALGVLLDNELSSLAHLIELGVFKLTEVPANLIEKTLSKNTGRQRWNKQVFVKSNLALIFAAPRLPVMLPEHGLPHRRHLAVTRERADELRHERPAVQQIGQRIGVTHALAISERQGMIVR